jgi:serine O-acetyltransferase
MLVRSVTRLLVVALGPAIAIMLGSPAASIVWEDASAWERPLGPRAVSSGDGKLLWLTYLLAKHREFRSLAFYRLAQCGPAWAVVAGVLCAIYRPQVALTIDCPSIGPGLFIEHGYATVITAQKLGAGCWINQNVTIGNSSRPGLPVLGDGVYVRTGAVVCGPVTVGDHAHIGANSVVTKDVPAGAVVGGVPARVIRDAAGRRDAGITEEPTAKGEAGFGA